ncbi:hypothetical protein OQJ65_17165 [Vibrio sp. Sgm 22]|uniref:hypothetical protein n=1 Tax=unclassified Vibrio TaxID=2614977 RepID=UPI0022495F60|nr:MULTISPECIES: hypothetical protein [unclassified Vibrio]MCX2760066.1 hypothetical protein [Vibrio sp. 14G-20]MCX2777054.1 hypothetical protein [Vibrio sp. Sgm 22]
MSVICEGNSHGKVLVKGFKRKFANRFERKPRKATKAEALIEAKNIAYMEYVQRVIGLALDSPIKHEEDSMLCHNLVAIPG